MNSTLEYLHFKGLEASVELRVDQSFHDALPTVFPSWPHEIIRASTTSFANVTLEGGKYTLTSPFMEKAVTFSDPANTLCALIVELAWARLRENPQHLCLHGAAVEFAGRLLIFPSTRRAGKSTLTVALAAAGKKIFTDDFLPLEISPKGQVLGISSGISPRLRLPVPDQIGPKARTYIGARNMIANRQYQFVSPRSSELAAFGETAPIGGIIFLERTDGASASIELVSHADALTTLITQNFSRAMNAGGILKILEFITQSAPAYRLKYDEAEPAIALLEDHFQTWPDSPPTLPEQIVDDLLSSALDITLPETTLDTSNGSFLHASGITVVSSEGEKFLTGRNGQSIHYLNDSAAMIWQLLDEPTSVSEAIEMLCVLYPEQPADQISVDVHATFREFANNNLLQTANPICQTPAFEANLVQ